MSGPNEKKPGKKKHGKGSRKAKPSQNQKPDQMLDEKPEPLQSHKLEQLESHEPEPLQSQKPDQLESKKPEPRQDSYKPCETAVASENAHSIDFQTLATASGNYTKKSFEETKAFVEKLSGVRSLDKVVEIQTEFAKQAYETFVTESQKIRELYRGLAKQNLRPFEGLIDKKTKGTR